MTDVEIIKVNETFSYGSPIILLYAVNQKSKIILNYVKLAVSYVFCYRGIMGCCPLGIDPHPQPLLVGSVSGVSSFVLWCHWDFYFVLGGFYFVVWLELNNQTTMWMFPILPPYLTLPFSMKSSFTPRENLLFFLVWTDQIIGLKKKWQEIVPFKRNVCFETVPYVAGHKDLRTA